MTTSGAGKTRRAGGVVGVAVTVAAAILALAACAAEEEAAVQGDSADVVAGTCELFTRAGKKVDRSKLDDPFARLVLLGKTGGKCPVTLKSTLERAEAATKSTAG